MARIRLGFAFEEKARAHLAIMTQLSGLSQNQTLEALLVGLSNEEFTSAITRGKELLSLDKKGRLAQNRAARGVPLTAEERAALQSSMDAMRDLK